MKRHSLFKSDLSKQIDRASSATAQRSNHEGTDTLTATSELGSYILYHCGLVRVRLEVTKLGTVLLSCMSQCASSCTGKASMEPKRGNTPSTVILQELKIIKCSAALVETCKDSRPARLSLVTVCELDVRVR